MIILGLDPSISSFGYAVLDTNGRTGRESLVQLGVWATKPDANAKKKLPDRARRVGELGEKLIALMEQRRPVRAFVEGMVLGVATSRSTAQTLGRVRGLVEGICLAYKVPLVEFTPQAVKVAVTGKRDAGKELVAVAVRRLYGVNTSHYDATDALAVAHAGDHTFTISVPNYTPPPTADDGELDF